MKTTFPRSCLFVLALALPLQCLADVVLLKNGDRISGTVQKIEKGRVVVQTDYAGEISIDWKRIGSLRTDDALTLNLDDDKRLFGRLTSDSEINPDTVNVIRAEGEQALPVEMRHLESAQRGDFLQDKFELSGRLNIGASSTSGNTKTSTAHLDAELIARKGRDRYTAGGIYNHASDQDVETASNARLYGKYDHFFTRKWYTTLNATAEQDRFADIQFRGTGGVGVGYQAIESPRTNLALESGVEYVYTDHYETPTEAYPAVRLAVKFDYFLVPNRLQFYNTSELYIGQGDNEPSFARTQTGLRMPLWNNFVATLQYSFDWNAHPPVGFVHADKTTLFTLGYHW